MIFNPLFISGTSAVNEAGKSKLNNPSFLFSDIINVRQNAKGLGMDESMPSFNSFLGSAGNSMNYLISNTISDEAGLKGYKLSEKEIGGVLTELLKNSESVEVFSDGNMIYKNAEPGDNVYSILQKLLAELENGSDIKLNLNSGESKYSVDLKGLVSEFGEYNTAKIDTASVNETVNDSDEKDDDLSGLFGLLQDPRIFEIIENELPSDSVEVLQYLTADPEEFAKFESFLNANPGIRNKIEDAFGSNKQLVLEAMKDILKSSSSFNLNPEEINKLDQIAAFVMEDKEGRLPELLKFIDENSGNEKTNNYSFSAKIENLFSEGSNSRQIASEIISGLGNETVKSLISLYQSKSEFSELFASATPDNNIEVKALLENGTLNLKQLLPELQGMLESFDKKELVNALLSDESTAGIIKERVAGLLSKVEPGSATAGIDAAVVEKELLTTLKSDDKEFSKKLEKIVSQYDLKSNSELLSKSDTLKPVVEAVVAKLGKTNNQVKKVFEKIAGLSKPEVKSSGNLQNNGVNSTLENFLKIVASKSATPEMQSEASNSKLETESNKEFMIKISNTDIPEKEISQLTKLITREDVSVKPGERNLAKIIEKNLPKAEASPHKANAASNNVKKDNAQTSVVNKNTNDFRQIEEFIKSVSMKRSLAEAENQHKKAETIQDSRIVEPAMKPETPVIEKTVYDQTKSEAVKATAEGASVKSNEEAAVQSDSGKGFESNSGSESHKNTTAASANTIKHAAGVDKTFESQLKASVNNSDIQKRIKVIKDVELSRVNSELRNIATSKGSQNVTLKLNPALLGEVEVAIEIIENTVKANIEVENDSVRQVVNSGIEQLKQTLVQQGLQPQSINVSLSTPDERNSKFARNKKKNPGSKKFDLENEIEVDAPKNMGYNTYDYVA